MSTTTWVPALPTDSFGARLRLLRLAKGLTVDQIARLCDVPAPTWRTWERGASPHQMEKVVERIYRATGVNMPWLMWGISPDDDAAPSLSSRGGDTSPDLPFDGSRCTEQSAPLEEAA